MIDLHFYFRHSELASFRFLRCKILKCQLQNQKENCVKVKKSNKLAFEFRLERLENKCKSPVIYKSLKIAKKQI